MVKTKEQKLKERKEKNRTFKEDSSLAIIEDRITELESKIDGLMNK